MIRTVLFVCLFVLVPFRRERLNLESGRVGQKHVIVMDNCPSHGVKEVVDAWIDAGWEVEFLPPNMTDRLQVMDLGAISCRPSISFFFQLRLLSLIFLSS